jgi:hypothetical protein
MNNKLRKIVIVFIFFSEILIKIEDKCNINIIPTISNHLLDYF